MHQFGNCMAKVKFCEKISCMETLVIVSRQTSYVPQLFFTTSELCLRTNLGPSNKCNYTWFLVMMTISFPLGLFLTPEETVQGNCIIQIEVQYLVQ